MIYYEQLLKTTQDMGYSPMTALIPHDKPSSVSVLYEDGSEGTLNVPPRVYVDVESPVYGLAIGWKDRVFAE